jgi:penicillin-binding protein 1A
MVSTGAIDQATADRARVAPVKIVNGLEIEESSGLYFKEQVRRELVERFGWQRVYQGGLRVYTTIDPTLQRAAETIVEKGLSDIERRPGYKHPTGCCRGRQNAGLPEYLQGALGDADDRLRARWWADATSTRAASIARPRRSGSPAPGIQALVYAAARRAIRRHRSSTI